MSKSVTIFAKKLKKHLDSGGITVLTLSRITGISHQAIYKYSNGEVEAGLRNAEKIAEALGYSLSQFIEEKPHTVHTISDCAEAIHSYVKKQARK